MTAPQTPPRVALCFYGIARSLPVTAPSILAQIVAPLQARTEMIRLGHFFEHSAEAGEDVAHDTRTLLGLDDEIREAPGACLDHWGFDQLLQAGDFWNDGGVSLRNLVHQLHSLKTVTEMALEQGITHCMFLRPDLLYHDSFEPHLDQILTARPPRAFIPNWQHWKGGMNDRFAVCIGPKAIRAWGARAERMQRYCEVTQSPLQSERLVAFVLKDCGIPSSPLPIRASRVRASGEQVREDFRSRPFKRFRQRAQLMRQWKRLGFD
jgi:hypothetical protein